MERYDIVFQKLAEACAEEFELQGVAAVQELGEIDELRRLALEIQEPPPASYTTT
ncbi:MAG: hypothetical protein ACM3S5_11765 [Rhodospirillales bacterium]